MKICDYESCTGCFACMNICPAGAITVGCDSNDKTVPIVDETLCTGCNVCRKICPELTPVKGHSIKQCFAAWTKNNEDRLTCSSGGIAAGLSEYMQSEGGIVFGAGYDGSGRVRHICADTGDKLEQLKGSKYVQSSIGFSYREAKTYLDKGTHVLFTGTPCQIAGLYAYLRRDYDELVTVELICHGTPPQKYLDSYLDGIRSARDKSRVTFRGRYDKRLTVLNGDKILYSRAAENDLYLTAFYKMIILRDNCFKCRYASTDNRAADITVGDFWGLDSTTLKNSYGGKVSAVLINTDKGQRFWEKNDFVSEQRPISEAVNGNTPLSHPHEYPQERDVFLKYYKTHGFRYAVGRTSVPHTIVKSKVNSLKWYVKRLLGKV